jgi:hypothetical protein
MKNTNAILPWAMRSEKEVLSPISEQSAVGKCDFTEVNTCGQATCGSTCYNTCGCPTFNNTCGCRSLPQEDPEEEPNSGPRP